MTLESYVRGSSFDAITRANKKVNRALTGAAYSIGTNIEIVDAPGYGPLHNAPAMMELAKEAGELMIPQYPMDVSSHIGSGSTDMGDLSAVMPVIHPYCGGGQGTGHGNDYYIVDPVAACVDCAKWQLGMLYLLLKDGGVRAGTIAAEYKAPFASKEEYLAFIDSLGCSGDRIEYREDGTAVLR